MKLPLVLCLVAAVAWTGCKKDDAPAAREVKPLEGLTGKEEAAPPPPDPTAAPRPEVSAPAEPSGPLEPQQGAETLNSALSEWLDNGNPMIGSLDDFARLKLVGTMPKPPPGKKFVLDPKKKKVVVVNQ